MNKAQLVESVVKELKISKAAGEKAVKSVIVSIKKGLKKDKNVQLIGFGTFRVVNRKARAGRNPQTGEKIKIKASKSVGFKCGKDLKKSL
ncbi:MAG: HU family DNA-binding protein [Candidatus Ancaeobacter aquaticus]|nr:HU family DNA-binding protein [Candidatus Ancaeobacter aquaticus]